MKKFETRLRIIMTQEKLEGRSNLMGKAWQRIDRVEPPRPPVSTKSEAKEGCWYMWRSLACPSTSRTLFSGLRVSTHGKQVAPYSVRFLLTLQEGGVGPILPRVPHGDQICCGFGLDHQIPFSSYPI